MRRSVLGRLVGCVMGCILAADVQGKPGPRSPHLQWRHPPVLHPRLRATCACLGVAAVGRPGGRWNEAAQQLVRDLVRVRAQRSPPALRAAATSAWTKQWWATLAVAVQQAVSNTALGSGPRPHTRANPRTRSWTVCSTSPKHRGRADCHCAGRSRATGAVTTPLDPRRCRRKSSEERNDDKNRSRWRGLCSASGIFARSCCSATLNSARGFFVDASMAASVLCPLFSPALVTRLALCVSPETPRVARKSAQETRRSGRPAKRAAPQSLPTLQISRSQADMM